MVRNILILITIVLGNAVVLGQSDFSKSSILRLSATFGIGHMTKENLTSLFLPTSMDYYIDDRVSVRNDAVFFLGHEGNPSFGFLKNHAIFSGISYHLTKNKQFDPYVGLQSGMAIAQYGIIGDPTLIDLSPDAPYSKFWLLANGGKSNTTLNALISPHVGLNYFAKNYFHLFMDVRYIYGNYHSNYPMVSLNEIRFEFGLGFNLQMNKYIKKKV